VEDVDKAVSTNGTRRASLNLIVRSMIKRTSLLWSWSLICVPMACVCLVGHLHTPPFSDPSPRGVAIIASPAACVVSGIIAAQYPTHAQAGRLRRFLFCVVYIGALFCLCAAVDEVITMGDLDL
jgi:hypothetical protein